MIYIAAMTQDESGKLTMLVSKMLQQIKSDSEFYPPEFHKSLDDYKQGLTHIFDVILEMTEDLEMTEE